MTELAISIVGDGRYALGESPVWEERNALLYWTDGVVGTIYAAEEDGRRVGQWQFPHPVGSFCLTSSGKILAACETQLMLFDPVDAKYETLFRIDSERSEVRLNDGKVAPDGSFVFGEMDRNETRPIGQVYRFDKSGTAQQIAAGFVVFNGPAWSPAGDLFYASDSGAGLVKRYPYGPGGLGLPALISATDDVMTGSFDGSAMDEDGQLWSARIFGGRLTCFAPAGTVAREIMLPVCKPTSICFGGDDLSTLYVTSMGAQLLPHFPADGPLGGAIFRIEGLAVRGVQVPRFAE